MNSYHAVMSDAGLWTVEWSASGVLLGNVGGTFAAKGEALGAVFELSRREFLGQFKHFRANDGLLRDVPRKNHRV